MAPSSQRITESESLNPEQDVRDPHRVEDIHATLLHALGIDFHQELDTPVGRPMAISQGQVIQKLLQG